MKTFQSLDAFSPVPQGRVLTIGNFDGVHLGHAALVQKTIAVAQETGAAPCAMTFDPHPRMFFQPQAPAFCLMDFADKEAALAEKDIEALFVLPFNAELAKMPAKDFISDILKGRLGARHVVTGEDFTFGRGKEGNVEMLRQYFDVSVVPPVRTADNAVISSTRIREALAAARLQEAAALLGRPWTFAVPVIHGDKRGREIGYPTANQDISHLVALPFGIYAVAAQLEGEKVWRQGVANFGIRPMFESPVPLFETFIFGFDFNIYGNRLRVHPLKYLRPEKKFNDIQALQAQMQKDCIAAQAVAF